MTSKNTNKTEKKRKREQRIVTEMIRLFCRKNHKSEEKDGQGLCRQCRQLNEYARSRSEHCPFMAEKTFCANCRVHCYKPEMREQIRTVMRFSGPRMILYHPVMALWHLITSKIEKRKRNHD